MYGEGTSMRYAMKCAAKGLCGHEGRPRGWQDIRQGLDEPYHCSQPGKRE